jgi:hypothetical protein
MAFNAGRFEAGILKAMEAGTPAASGDQATFFFPAVGTSVPRSADNVPWDPAIAADRVAAAPVKVPCAAQYGAASDQATPFGDMSSTHLALTLLESDYAQVIGCLFVVYAGERFSFRSMEIHPLYSSGVRTMHFTREDA